MLKEQIFNELSKLTGIDAAIIRTSRLPPSTSPELAKPVQALRPAQNVKINEHSIQRTPLRLVIAALLYEPSLIKHMVNPEQLVRFPLAGIDLLVTLVEIIEEQPHIHTAGLAERLRNTEYEAIIIKALKWLDHSVDLAVLEREFIDSLQQVRRQGMECQLEQLVHKAQTSELTPQEQIDLSSLLADLPRGKKR
jgi:DNA primase